MKPALFPAILLLPLVLAGCQQGSPNADGASPQASGPGSGPGSGLAAGFDLSSAGKPAPATPLETNDSGETTTLADIFRANPGKKVLVNLWATWCAPCLEELPTLDALAASTEGRLLVVPVSQDMEGWRKVGTAFTAGKYPHLETLVESRMQLGLALGAKALPVTILYDDSGREVWRYLGGRDWTAAESLDRIGIRRK